MKECILHVGMHKTGTSSIQQTFFAHRGVLLNDYNIGFYDRFENHSELTPCFLNDYSDYSYLKLLNFKSVNQVRQHVENLRRQFFEFVSNFEGRYLLISAEDFSRFRLSEVQNLQNALEQNFDKVTVIIYVRHPYSYADSAAQQALKMGSTFEQISRDTFEHKSIFFDKTGRCSILPDYQNRVGNYAAVFGKENVILKNFDPKLFRENNVVFDFIDTAFANKGIDIKTLNANESLCLKSALLLEALNREVPVFIGGELNPNRARGVVLHLKKIQDGSKFHMLNFDWHLYRELVTEDCLWLEDYTNGNVQFDLNKLPEKKSYPMNDLERQAIDMNDLLVRAETAENRSLIFLNMWRLEVGDDFDEESFVNTLRLCKDVKTLDIVFHNLRRTGHRELSIRLKDKLGKPYCTE